jgi:hypothetical protein
MRSPRRIKANSRAESSRLGFFFFGGSSSSRIVTVTRRFAIGSPQNVSVNRVGQSIGARPNEKRGAQIGDRNLAGIALKALAHNPWGITAGSIDAHRILAGYIEAERSVAGENEALAGHELLNVGAVRHKRDETPTPKAEQSKAEEQGFHRVGSIARVGRAAV